MQTEKVVLVDPYDRPRGTMEKIKAHQSGELHRAFSIFIFNSHGELMLQQRAFTKYHSGGLWTNTCCSHPRPGESPINAAHRRLKEEMGFDCHLNYAFNFIYRAELDNDLVEHELDYIFIGNYNGVPYPDKNEVRSWQLCNLQEIANKISAKPQQFTEWFKIIFSSVAGYVGEPKSFKLTA
jgi:isopentenyl-diphosphate Delta-isomerase